MVHEGLIDKKEAIKRVKPDEVSRMLHRGVDPAAKTEVVGKGLPASPGAAIGAVVFDYKVAEKLGSEGQKVILVRPETKPEDMPGLIYAQGVLTSRGGMTCHAAVVARGMGKPAIVGCDALHLDIEHGKATVGKAQIKEGDIISIDGTTGSVYIGSVPLVEPKIGGAFQEILEWADEIKRLGVKANADTPQDAKKARELGAKGIGLCRTGTLFMAAERLPRSGDDHGRRCRTEEGRAG